MKTKKRKLYGFIELNPCACVVQTKDFELDDYGVDENNCVLKTDEGFWFLTFTKAKQFAYQVFKTQIKEAKEAMKYVREQRLN